MISMWEFVTTEESKIKKTEQYKNMDNTLPLVSEYLWNKEYLNFVKMNILNNKVVSFDEDKQIPVNTYKKFGGPHPYPITIGIYGLECFTKYLIFKDNAYLDKAKYILQWFLSNQNQKTGAWQAPFDYHFFIGRTEILKAGWSSALAQGYAISFLARMFSITEEERIMEAVNLAIIPFLTPVDKGGVLRLYQDSYYFYEEYPTTPASYVLNGFMFAILGIYDGFKLTRNPDFERLYRKAIKTLKKMLSLYDLGYGTAYDLTHHSVSYSAPNIAREGYHRTHTIELSAINSIENREFEEILQRWIKYNDGYMVKTN